MSLRYSLPYFIASRLGFVPIKDKPTRVLERAEAALQAWVPPFVQVKTQRYPGFDEMMNPAHVKHADRKLKAFYRAMRPLLKSFPAFKAAMKAEPPLAYQLWHKLKREADRKCGHEAAVTGAMAGLFFSILWGNDKAIPEDWAALKAALKPTMLQAA